MDNKPSSSLSPDYGKIISDVIKQEINQKDKKKSSQLKKLQDDQEKKDKKSKSEAEKAVSI